MKNRKLLFTGLIAILSTMLLLSQFVVSAAPTTITDTTADSATNDGIINENEYIGCTTGTGNGFGDVIGNTGQLCVDSSAAGALNFGLIKGEGHINDAVVIYIDSVEGGAASTENFTDDTDGLRRAISGKDGANVSVLTFAPGFTADYAIAFAVGTDENEQGFAGLWELNENDEHTFIRSVNLTPAFPRNNANFEIDLLLSDIGLIPGDTFLYVATYISQTAWRSNEFQGAAGPFTGPEGGNYGYNPVTLAAGDYNTFHSYSAPAETGTPVETEGTPVATEETPVATEETPVETPTATEDTPVETPTATATEVSGVELLANGDFENKNEAEKPDLAPWVLKNGVGEKIKCNKENKTFSYSGDCAFRFKGGAGENSKIQQTVELDGLTFNAGDAINLSLFHVAGKPATKAKVKVVIKFSDDTERGKIKESLNSEPEYVETTGTYVLEGSAVNKIKIIIGNKSATGKLYVDAVTLTQVTAGGEALIPLP